MGIVFTFVLFFILFGMSIAPDFMEVKEGSGVSFLDLWKQVGLTVDDRVKGIYRNTFLDTNFTEGCPYKISIKFISTSKPTVILRYNHPFMNNTWEGIFASPVNQMSYESNSLKQSVIVHARSEEDVIFKGFAENDEQDIFFAVYLPKNMTGYPKYYVKPYDKINISLGNIPGFEHLFDVYEKLKVFGNFNQDCFVDATTIQGTTYVLPAVSEETTTSINETEKVLCSDGNQVFHTCYLKSADDQPSVSTSQPVWTKTTYSSIECCSRCSQDCNLCKSIFFIQSTNTCIGLYHAESSSDKPVNAVHFVLKNV